MKKNLACITLFVILSGQLIAQKEANNWYFGYNAGISFNNSPPVALTNVAIHTDEGCASISTHGGKLLFYTDGISVWNRNHNLMPNGTGLKGNASSTQSAIIVPIPGENLYYYIFTVDCQENHLANGIQYSLVDMNADGGNGDIASKNNLIIAPACEKATVVKHGSKKAYWLITHKFNSDSFFTYFIDNDGINKKPVASKSGTFVGTDWGSAAGYLKSSPDGKKIAMGNNSGHLFEVFDFDNETGIISGAIKFSVSLNAYGLEFSPNSKYLYIISEDGYESTLSQYDLYAGTESDIIFSGIEINHNGNIKNGVSYGLQLGPDNKIYVTRVGLSMLDVISSPDIRGLGCNYILDALPLQGKICRLGLPNLIKSYITPEPFYYKDTCENSITRFYIPDSALIDSVRWYFGNNDSTSGLSAQHLYRTGGTYSVTLVEYIGGVRFNYTKVLTIAAASKPFFSFLSGDTIICNNSVVLRAFARFGTYKWQDGSTDSFYVATTSGLYHATISTPCGVFEDSVKITFFNQTKINLGNDTVICLGDSILLDATYPMSTFIWQNGSTNPDFKVKDEGVYKVKISTPCGNYTVSKNVFVKDCNCYMYVPDVFTPNGDSMNETFKPSICKTPDYTMRIYNRWGEILFETHDIDVGWNGMFQNKKVPEGAYVYYIQARNRDKTFINRKGDFYVILPSK